MKLISLLLIAFHSIAIISGQMQCRDESGKEVDWYVVYKLPRVSKGKDPLKTGLNYAYITSHSKSGWTLSDQSITDGTKSIFGQTLKSIYSSKLSSKLTSIMYNDDPPEDSASFGGAHAKGVVAADDTQGFWLIHSVPNFASELSSHSYEYPSTGTLYGQSALCISFKISEIDKIVEQLLYMQPTIYSIQVSSALMKESTLIKDLKNKEWNSGKMNIRSISSSAGVNFTSFSKSPGDQVDLYADIVAPHLNTNLYVETWRKGNGTPLPPVCNKVRTVENVDEIGLKFDNSEETGHFSYLNDHSKWALSKTQIHPYVCFGDINRMHSQYKRGGGTTCFQTPQVWKYLDEWISKADKC